MTMTGSGSDGVGAVSQADLTTYEPGTANEAAQLQKAPKTTVNDIVDTTRRPHSGKGTYGDGMLGAHLGSSSDEVSLPGNGPLGADLPGQPIGSPVVGTSSLDGSWSGWARWGSCSGVP